MKFKKAKGIRHKELKFNNGMYLMDTATQEQSFEVVVVNKSFVGLEIPKEHAANVNSEYLYCIRGEEGDYEKIEKLGTVNVDLSAYILIRPEDIDKVEGSTEITNIEFTSIMHTPAEFLSAVFDKEIFGI